MARGRLRVYLGAAPGVGKTVAMLSEGRRRADRGTTVVVGVVEDHGRAFTREAADGLPVVPRHQVVHRGVLLPEMDTAAILALSPQVVLVDELAHTNAPGSDHHKRWQDVDVLLEAGIDVITTVNVQHLESLNDAVAAITGITQQETVPDEVVRAADAIELVDMSPQALRRRLAHGHVYPAERIDAALGNYFREGNLTALRELALLWVADRVEEGLTRYRSQHGIATTWPSRERIVVALPGGPSGEHLLRRGARIAGRQAGRTLAAVHVVRSDGTAGADPAVLEQQRQLAEKLGGDLHLVVGDDPVRSVLQYARSINATQIVVGASTHSRLRHLLRPSAVSAIVGESGDIDVHVVTHPAGAVGRRPARDTTAAAIRGVRAVRARPPLAYLAAVVVPGVLSALLLPLRSGLDLSTVLLVLLLGVLGNALLGGVVPAALAALIAGLLANLLFSPPYGSLAITSGPQVFSIAAFIAVGVIVASIVDRGAARAREAARGRADAQLITSLVTEQNNAADPLTAVLDAARVGFGMTAAVLWGTPEPNAGPAGSYQLIERSGADISVIDRRGPVGADVVHAADSRHVLALYGHPVSDADRRLVEVAATQVGAAHERRRLAGQAARTEHLEQADAVRTAILAALSHDLRNPLATIKTTVSSLRNTHITLSQDDRSELLEAADHAAGRLDDLLANLLDLSRLQTGTVRPVRRPASVDEIVLRALIEVGAGQVDDDIPDNLPLVDTDAGLLERVLANIVANACRYSPPGRKVRVDAAYLATEDRPHVQIRVIDHGTGVADQDKPAMFAPFQRLGDVPAGSGLGLGLAVASGLAEAVDVEITTEDTPGGGLTMTLSVPLARTSLSQETAGVPSP